MTKKILLLASPIVIFLAAHGAWAQAASGDQKNQELARGADEILGTVCLHCHGEPGQAPRGGFNVSDRGSLLQRLVPGSPDQSLIIQRIGSAADPMPPAGSGRTLTDGQKAVLRAWVAAGAPAYANAGAAQAAPAEPLTPEAVYAAVASDLAKLPADRRGNYRYFSLADVANDKAAPLPVNAIRAALIEMVNFTSTAHGKADLKPMDGNDLVLRLDIRSVGWDPAVWKNKVMAQYPLKPAAAPAANGRRTLRDAAIDQTVNADWFVAKASLGDVYAALLRQPDRLDTARYTESNLRAGFAQSGTEANNRIIARYHSNGRREDFLYRSFNQDANVDGGNIFAKPLGPGNGPLEFKHADSDNIRRLPNGALEFFTVDNGNVRLPNLNERTPRKCLGCHGGGLIDREDQIRASLAGREQSFNSAERASILKLYAPPDQFKAQLTADNKSFENLMASLQLPPSAIREPVNATANWYEGAISLGGAAAALGAAPEKLIGVIRGDPGLGRELGSLLIVKNGPDGANVNAGVVRRDLFEQMYGNLSGALARPSGAALASASPRAEPRAIDLPADVPLPAGADPRDRTFTPSPPVRFRSPNTIEYAGQFPFRVNAAGQADRNFPIVRCDMSKNKELGSQNGFLGRAVNNDASTGRLLWFKSVDRMSGVWLAGAELDQIKDRDEHPLSVTFFCYLPPIEIEHPETFYSEFSAATGYALDRPGPIR